MRRIAWTAQARDDVRALDKAVALRLLHALDRFAKSGSGDVKALQGNVDEMRLRVGDYRLFFVYTEEDVLEVRSVRHRREAYR